MSDYLIMMELRNQLLTISDLANGGGVVYLREYFDAEADTFPIATIQWDCVMVQDDADYRFTELSPVTEIEGVFRLTARVQALLKPPAGTEPSQTAILARQMAVAFDPAKYVSLGCSSAMRQSYFPKAPEDGGSLWAANASFVFTFVDNLET